jgi:hypothetical protein
MRAFCRVATLLGVLALAGCNPWSSRCETLCESLIDGCGFGAWSSVEQCRAGCVDDMYRRSDAEELFSCYEDAVATPSIEDASRRVSRAREAGLFDAAIAEGSWDEPGEVQRALELGRCDLFAFVQCKVEAVQVVPRAPLVEN